MRKDRADSVRERAGITVLPLVAVSVFCGPVTRRLIVGDPSLRSEFETETGRPETLASAEYGDEVDVIISSSRLGRVKLYFKTRPSAIQESIEWLGTRQSLMNNDLLRSTRP